MSAYGNPIPYDLVELERASLIGRLKYQRWSRDLHNRKGDTRRYKRATGIIDELLGHLSEAEARAKTAAIEQVESANDKAMQGTNVLRACPDTIKPRTSGDRG